jgi:hypothetical protein
MHQTGGEPTAMRLDGDLDARVPHRQDDPRDWEQVVATASELRKPDNRLPRLKRLLPITVAHAYPSGGLSAKYSLDRQAHACHEDLLTGAARRQLSGARSAS